MRILIVGKFLHHVGGVETYIEWLGSMLPGRGHELRFFGMRPPVGETVMQSLEGRTRFSPTREYNTNPVYRRAIDTSQAIYSRGARRGFESFLSEFRPDVVHYHGTCYQLTPSVVLAARKFSVPSVVTAHEYKLVCANQRFWNYAEQRPCLDCVGEINGWKTSANILRRRCIKGSVLGSAVAALEQPLAGSVWRSLNPIVHVPSRYMEDVITASSQAPSRVRYGDLPWPDSGDINLNGPSGGQAQLGRSDIAYMGRLEPEKGVGVLLKAWAIVEPQIPRSRLIVLGSGSERSQLESLAAELGIRRVQFRGSYERCALGSILSGVVATVHPSIWPENSPYTVRESLLAGVPAIVSDAGGLPEMVSPSTGRIFEAGNSVELAQSIMDELSLERAGTAELLNSVEARRITPTSHLDFLENLYLEAQQ